MDEEHRGTKERGADGDRLRAILDSSLTPVVLWEAQRDESGRIRDFRYVECNAAAMDFLQRPHGEIVGSSLSDLFSSESVDIARDWAVDVVESGRPLLRPGQCMTNPMTGTEGRYDISMAAVGDGVSFTWRDVTEEFTAAEALQESEESLRVAMLSAPVGMNLTAPSGRFLRVNPAMCAFLGRDEQTMLAATWQDLTHPDDLAQDQALVDEIIRGERDSYRITKRFLRPDGEVVWGDLSVAAVRDPGGALQFFVAQAVDVTELVSKRDQLADSREHFRLLAEQTSDVVLQVSDAGVLTWISPSVQSALGWSPQEVLGRPMSDFIAPDAWTRVAATLDATRESAHEASGQFRVRTRDDRWLWMDAAATTVRDRHGRLMRIVRLRDVDAEVTARIALQNSEERFRTAMRVAPLGMALTTPDGVVIQVNGALAAMLGQWERSLNGSRVTSFTHPEDRHVDLDMWNELHSGRSHQVTREKRLVDAEGRTLWVINAVAGVKDENGQFTSFVSQFMDVTESREARAELERMAQVDPLTELQNRRAVLDRMDSILSHPPRTGMRLAVLYCDVDRFKEINDGYGHAVGDQLLVEISHRIVATVREGDAVGRLGGDEFLVLLPQMRDLDDALLVAEKIRAAVAAPLTVGPHTLRTAMSMGLTLVEPQDTAERAVARADKALYTAKERGRNQVVANCLVDA